MSDKDGQMSEWVLVPRHISVEQWDAMEKAHQSPAATYGAAMVARPPMPRAEWDAMVERGARALWVAAGNNIEIWDHPPTELWRVHMNTEGWLKYREMAAAALRAALPGLKVEGDTHE